MKLAPPAPLKPIDLARGPGAGKPNTALSAADRSGVISHARRNATTGNAATPDERHAQLTQQTQRWVAQTFFGTMLKQMHQSPFRSEMFEGGRGGQAFTEMFDQKLVEHMSRGVGQKLVKSITRRLEANEAYRKQGSPTAAPAGAAAVAGGAPGAGQHSADPRGNHGGGNDRNARPAPTPAGVNPYQNVRVHVAPALGA